jgi:hypothetical protein
MTADFRETVVGCSAALCRFNVKTGIEPTCMMKLISLDETGRCRNAEGRPVLKPQTAAKTGPGHFENGVWIP